MTPCSPRSRRMQHVTATGTALAGVLVPLVAGVVIAKVMGADPMAPVNTLIAHGGRRIGIPASQWRGCRGYALLGLERGQRDRARCCRYGRLRRGHRSAGRPGCAAL
ncbi:hypothetical protein [Streptomyces sp. NPDC002187]|uniref:hypothetical protein n=1 Tax=Streptomyces sp. NPDC002187 TaxID=3364637 RepID=UPI0036B48D00